MRLRLEDDARLTIKVVATFDKETKTYSYALAEPIPKGLGPEAFIGAIVEVSIPQWAAYEPGEFPFGHRVIYSHVSVVAYETYMDDDTGEPTDFNYTSIGLRCTGDINEFDWPNDEIDIYIQYYPYDTSNADWVFDERHLPTETIIKLTKTVDEATGDITYDGVLTGKIAERMRQPQFEAVSGRPLTMWVNGINGLECTSCIESIINTGYNKPAIIRLSRYLDYEPSEVTVTKSQVEYKKGVYSYYLNFTVPAANVKPEM